MFWNQKEILWFICRSNTLVLRDQDHVLAQNDFWSPSMSVPQGLQEPGFHGFGGNDRFFIATEDDANDQGRCWIEICHKQWPPLEPDLGR